MSKVAVITGVASGIGKATAELFGKQGWQVIGIDVSEPAESLTERGDFFLADVSDSEAWEKIVAGIREKQGRVDALVNNAGVQVCKPFVETTPQEWNRVMGVNLTSVYLAVRNVYPLMEKAGGAIVNVSSVHAIATSANIAAYAASKGGLLALTRALAIELGPSRIRVNAVLPGAVDTPMLQTGLTRGHLAGENLSELVEQLGSKHVIGRIGLPVEIAEAIYFLADGDRSSFMTGQSLVVDGGATARLSTE
ncbi:SDR family NAD(P)-dependent oxidoreductase [Okeania sp. SIO2B3]|uniref:SDR family NAD(P)-dependent oxidoreductase n=1 Tax=Okeania sp. SIO2B3 TaxID=2607784 RepID=UPI0013C070F8|nr:SDR family oxidoreductase [Okeania sp. SIO2B3]NET41046.1 SDR family oxidoreductase [Okeania sp. SIO2B3]